MMKSLSVIAAMLTLAIPSSAETDASNPVADWQPYDGAEISFDVLRKGKPFGKHIVSFASDASGDLKVTTDVDLKVTVGPFTVFHYQLDSEETWKDGSLVALNGKTNDDGRKAFVRAERTVDGLSVDGSAYSGTAPIGIVPSSHWNIEQVRSDRMLSTESGEILSMEIISKGRETVMIEGNSIPASRHTLDSDIDIDLWYDDEGRWVKLTFDARGQMIEYRLSKFY